ncbi:translation initiation factor IF-2-like [Moschus berezovskii]|uniref:translation initiation factor IF-2-like n=1 Tax=Moschus berezovskii TaxID=68408 RepID=UPI002443D858|nr:translation initiation factor IF-2-like [Moschus berezovskii]
MLIDHSRTPTRETTQFGPEGHSRKRFGHRFPRLISCSPPKQNPKPLRKHCRSITSASPPARPDGGGGQPREGVWAEAAQARRGPAGRSGAPAAGGAAPGREAPRGRGAAPARRAHTGGAAARPPPGCLRGGAAQLRPRGGRVARA